MNVCSVHEGSSSLCKCCHTGWLRTRPMTQGLLYLCWVHMTFPTLQARSSAACTTAYVLIHACSSAWKADGSTAEQQAGSASSDPASPFIDVQAATSICVPGCQLQVMLASARHSIGQTHGIEHTLDKACITDLALALTRSMCKPIFKDVKTTWREACPVCGTAAPDIDEFIICNVPDHMPPLISLGLTCTNLNNSHPAVFGSDCKLSDCTCLGRNDP